MRKNRVFTKVMLMAVATAMAVAGCGGSQGNQKSAGPGPSGSAVESKWTVETSVATYRTTADAWHQALLEGKLELLDSGCLVITTPNPDGDPFITVPLFPISHEKVEFDGRTLTLGEQTFKLGDTIGVGGSSGENGTPEDAIIPSVCAGYDTWNASPQGQ